MAYKNLTITSIDCFGMTHPKETSWADMLAKADKNFSAVDKATFEKSLKDNVDASYYRLVTFFVKDLDTDYEYAIFFHNERKLWDIEFSVMSGNKNPNLILPNEKAELLKNDLIKAAVERAVVVIRRADSLIDEVVMQHIENGELLEVDETKLAAIQFFCKEKLLNSNMKLRKYVR